ncbi:histidine phosphatase family protein [Nakamurella flavida]|uniref:Histidine phosphatase family protein n=1 Tax=Nakamurella flavida TaxID=363630 RepID=A0A939C274_9ACTN|nr:histidine phosphatase family protein [Nakamurella flavida]MBM9475756.1 histidine phosphatase family protein [Nakamurella flavida]MDP9777964.1 broad specificity phosphatase PhoE [Nakamurella flavida]
MSAPELTTVHLLRHGKVHNPDNVLYGRLPGYVLSRSGHAMARAAADFLAGADVAHLAASPLVRAQQTAEPMVERFGVPIVTDERLIEAGNSFQGRRMDRSTALELATRPWRWPALRDPFTPSWGEPYLDIAHRMLAAVSVAVQVAAGREAVLVSHQLPVYTVRRFLEGRRLWHDPRRRQCSLASLTSLHFRDGIYVGLSYAEPARHIAAENDGDTTPAAGVAP